MHKILFINNLIINPSNWLTSFIITATGVGLAISIQELLNWVHRKDRTSKFISFLIKEAEENLLILTNIIETSDGTKDKLKEENTNFGFPAVLVLLGITLRIKTNAYEAIKQNEHYLTISPKNSLKIFSSYSRLADIGFYISTMVNAWNESETEAIRENVGKETIDKLRKEQIFIIIGGARYIALEAKGGLTNLIEELKK